MSAMGQVREHVDDVGGAVVVGTDGSAGATNALRFAAEEARLRAVPLVVVRGWSIRTAPTPAGAEPGAVPPLVAFEETVATAVTEQVREVLGEDPGIEVVAMPVHGPGEQVLVEAAATAALVVVGKRGHGSLLGRILGGTSEYVVTHAPGPVVVVHHE
jgi:nucleotide-binding universal stress UspA family protein